MPLLMVSLLPAVPFIAGDAVGVLLVGTEVGLPVGGLVGTAGAEEAVGTALVVSSGPHPASRSAVPVTAQARAMAATVLPRMARVGMGLPPDVCFDDREDIPSGRPGSVRWASQPGNSGGRGPTAGPGPDTGAPDRPSGVCGKGLTRSHAIRWCPR
ncbi:hypothetical protein GCM10009665_24710 [Kitasatospora nipponensis]|uniref:Uncharacterized protein n=1 Tax=Kitasatospora nipponensis TaxID=258049 RepID=A0ABN1W563_9ACTN